MGSANPVPFCNLGYDALDIWRGEPIGAATRCRSENDDDANESGIKAQENHPQRMAIAANSDRYLKIPGCTHGGHHCVLRAFLDSLAAR